MTIYVVMMLARCAGFVVFIGHGRAGRGSQLTVGRTNRAATAGRPSRRMADDRSQLAMYSLPGCRRTYVHIMLATVWSALKVRKKDRRQNPVDVLANFSVNIVRTAHEPTADSCRNCNDYCAAATSSYIHFFVSSGNPFPSSIVTAQLY